MKQDNFLSILCLVPYRKLQVVSSKWCLLRSCKHWKNKGEFPFDKCFIISDELPWINDCNFLQTDRMSSSINICKHHPLIKVLNYNKTAWKEKTKSRTRNNLMCLLCFLVHSVRKAATETVKIGISKDVVRVKMCETHASKWY